MPGGFCKEIIMSNNSVSLCAQTFYSYILVASSKAIMSYSFCLSHTLNFKHEQGLDISLKIGCMRPNLLVMFKKYLDD